MKKYIRLLSVILILITLFSLIGCCTTPSDDSIKEGASDRFKTIESGGKQPEFRYRIMVDTETNVMYVFVIEGRGECETAGFTALLDKNGKPMIWKGY